MLETNSFRFEIKQILVNGDVKMKEKWASLERRLWLNAAAGDIQLVEIADAHSENIGISPTASTFPEVNNNWPEMPARLQRQFKPCLLAEARTPPIDASYLSWGYSVI